METVVAHGEARAGKYVDETLNTEILAASFDPRCAPIGFLCADLVPRKQRIVLINAVGFDVLQANS